MTIVAPALRMGELILSMPRPAKHSDIIRLGITKLDGAQEYGFLTSMGTFVDRHEAGRIAGLNRKLFSEDLW
jgi:hypothetical protein